MSTASLLVVCSVMWAVVVPAGSVEGCRQVLAVTDVLNHARALDGKIVCVRGLVVPGLVPQWKGAALMSELAPLSVRRTAGPPSQKLGLIGWAAETGIDEKYFNLESFDLLPGPDAGAKVETGHALEVTLRAAVMYKRNLRSKIPPAPSYPAEIQAMGSARYDVELVMLQVLNVKWIKAPNQAAR